MMPVHDRVTLWRRKPKRRAVVQWGGFESSWSAVGDLLRLEYPEVSASAWPVPAWVVPRAKGWPRQRMCSLVDRWLVLHDLAGDERCLVELDHLLFVDEAGLLASVPDIGFEDEWERM